MPEDTSSGKDAGKAKATSKTSKATSSTSKSTSSTSSSTSPGPDKEVENPGGEKGEASASPSGFGADDKAGEKAPDPKAGDATTTSTDNSGDDTRAGAPSDSTTTDTLTENPDPDPTGNHAGMDEFPENVSPHATTVAPPDVVIEEGHGYEAVGNQYPESIKARVNKARSAVADVKVRLAEVVAEVVWTRELANHALEDDRAADYESDEDNDAASLDDLRDFLDDTDDIVDDEDDGST